MQGERMGKPLGQSLRKCTTQLLAEGFSATLARDKEPPVPASAPRKEEILLGWPPL